MAYRKIIGGTGGEDTCSRKSGLARETTPAIFTIDVSTIFIDQLVHLLALECWCRASVLKRVSDGDIRYGVRGEVPGADHVI